MLTAVLQSLPIALGLLLAAAPMAIIAVMLTIKRPPSVARAFLGGWLLGLTCAGAVVLSLADLLTPAGGSATWVRWVKIAIGAVLVVLAVQKWRSRPRAGDPPKPSKVMTAAETMTARQAFRLALLLAALNPKNLLLIVAGTTVIAEATPRVYEQAVALCIFVAVASIGVAAPVVVNAVLGERSGPVLAPADRWMTDNSAAIMTVVLLALGLILIVNGLRV